jgi:hypothetical protein
MEIAHLVRALKKEAGDAMDDVATGGMHGSPEHSRRAEYPQRVGAAENIPSAKKLADALSAKNSSVSVDPGRLGAGITIWRPVGWGRSSFGHVSTNINGTTYSYGPAGMAVSPASDYLAKNSFRGRNEVKLNLTPQQEKLLQACLSVPQGSYNALTRNCAAPVQDCLNNQGIDTENQTLPLSLGNKLLDMGLVNDVQNYPSTRPANGSSAPWAR